MRQVSDRFNVGARIVPMDIAGAILQAKMGLRVVLPTDEYDRVQLLTFDAADGLVDFLRPGGLFADIWALLKYGEDSPDFPLCADFAKAFVVMVLFAAAKVGLAVRAYFFRLHYTKKSGGRHAIDGVVLADGSVKFVEPQTLAWLAEPVDLESYDAVKL